MNQINQIEIYRWNKTWAFNDEARDLEREPFVSGVEKILDELIDPLSNKAIVTFSKDKFPTEENLFNIFFLYESDGGAWYQYAEGKKVLTGWFCPAFFLYFDRAPNKIYFTINPLD